MGGSNSGVDQIIDASHIGGYYGIKAADSHGFYHVQNGMDLAYTRFDNGETTTVFDNESSGLSNIQYSLHSIDSNSDGMNDQVQLQFKTQGYDSVTWSDASLTTAFNIQLDQINGGFDPITFGGNSANDAIGVSGAFSADNSFTQNGESIAPEYWIDTSYLSRQDYAHEAQNTELQDYANAVFGDGSFSSR